MTYKLAWFSTGRDAAARDLLKTAMDAMRSGEIAAQIDCVFCSRNYGEATESDRFIEQVRSYGLPLICFSYQRYKDAHAKANPGNGFPQWRQDYDNEIIRQLAGFNPEICVMAGYMLIISPGMCRHFNLINLHPAAPSGPTGTWQEVIWKLIDERAQTSGVMMHLVTPELDRGPAVTCCHYSLRGGAFDQMWQHCTGKDTAAIKREEGESSPLFQAIRAEGLKREFPLIIATIRAFSLRQVKVVSGRILDAHDKIIPGYDLSSEIDRQIAGI
ncbi:MAG: phosphoglycerate transporter [Dehalococcoidia bacterium]|nr:phosphoglycerate transporter [Dehalococcoidia bacterium]